MIWGIAGEGAEGGRKAVERGAWSVDRKEGRRRKATVKKPWSGERGAWKQAGRAGIEAVKSDQPAFEE
jgi:hypothetical protein